MESSGRPEQVHVSEVTSSLISEHYNLEDGEEVDGSLGHCILKNVLFKCVSLSY